MKADPRTRRKEARALGWYAVHRAYFTDWFKTASDRLRPRSRREPQDDNADEQDNDGPKDENSRKLEEAVKESHGILAKATTVFPFTPFPDTITIDRHKLTIVRRHLWTEQALSVPIENIKNVQADMGPIFGSITVISDQFVNSEQRLEYLHRGDVDKIQKLVQGIVMATKENIDISEVDTEELKTMLTKLGAAHAKGM
jgi:hypothetical protein